jgi:anti-sigma regulatory factor (Ser/Thr protein kinase)
MIVLPPSFPYGGMENPTLTFLTPTVIAGDRSLVSVIADELVANAISYGEKGRDPCSVTVEVELDHERVTVILTDDGPPFDPFGQDAPDTTLSVDERPIGGLGIHLVKQLMDNVSYQRREGHNVVVLVKQLVNG